MRESLTPTVATQGTLTPQQVAEMMPLVALYYQDHGLNLVEELQKNDKRLRVAFFEQ